LTYPNGKFIDYFYDMAGRVSHVIDGDSTLKISYEYWPDGSIKQKTLGLPENLGPGQYVDYRYNCRGWLESINNGIVDTLTVGSGDHYALRLTYDSSGYGGFGYYNGNVTSYDLKVSPGILQNTIKQKFDYDLVDRLRHESYDGFQVPDSINYTYDFNGNIQVASLYNHTSSTQYDYIYYPNSNRLEQISNLAAGDSNFVYTPAGAMAEYGNLEMNMIYNPYQELVKRSRVFDLETNSVGYRYNTAGKRIAKDYRYYFQYLCGGDPTDPTDPIDPPPQPLNSPPSYLIDDSSAIDFGDISLESLEKITPTSGDVGDPTYCLDSGEIHTGYYYFGDNMLCEYSGPAEANLKGNYVYVNGQREAQFLDESSEARYLLTDHLGSVVATVRPDGQLRSFCQYRPFGKIQYREINDPFVINTFGYTGQKLDEELGVDWNYMGARYYDPELRIFTQVDPQAAKYPSLSPYLYCANNPMKNIDPDGQAMMMQLPTEEEYKSKLPEWVPDWVGSICYGIQMDPVIGPTAVGAPAKSVGQSLASKLTSKVAAKIEKEVAKMGDILKIGGRLGKKPHRAAVNIVADELRDIGYKVTGGGGIEREEFLKGIIKGSTRGGNYIDVTAMRGKSILRAQVGKQTKAGIPIKQELRKIEEIRLKRPGEDIIFVPYNNLGD
ncbi:MAG: RHS repeat-associated core domain-containing protein, partial [Candidatus Zixiibacteriota bacterium]